MRIHHVSCGVMRPWGGKLVDGFSHGLQARFVNHCLIIETAQGLVLVDTGFGREEIRHPENTISPFFLKTSRIQFSDDNTALRHVEKLGFQAEDVRHILLTHMDFENAGGISDFPQARVHVMGDEWAAANRRHSWLDRRRYRPNQWQHHAFWHFYEPVSEGWFGFASVHELTGLPPEIKMISLPGHTWGHAGIAVKTNHGWLLHAGDAYFYRQELEAKGYHCPVGLRLYQRFMEVNHAKRINTLRKLRDLVIDHSDEVRVCSAHDALELTVYQAQQLPLREQFERPSSGALLLN